MKKLLLLICLLLIPAIAWGSIGQSHYGDTAWITFGASQDIDSCRMWRDSNRDTSSWEDNFLMDCGGRNCVALKTFSALGSWILKLRYSIGGNLYYYYGVWNVTLDLYDSIATVGDIEYEILGADSSNWGDSAGTIGRSISLVGIAGAPDSTLGDISYIANTPDDYKATGFATSAQATNIQTEVDNIDGWNPLSDTNTLATNSFKGIVRYSFADSVLRLKGLHLRGTTGDDTAFIAVGASGGGAGLGMFIAGAGTGEGVTIRGGGGIGVQGANAVEIATQGVYGMAGITTSGGIEGFYASGGTSDISGDITGGLSGNVGGNVAGDVQGNVDGSVASVTGNVGGNITGNVQGTVAGVTGSVSGNVVGFVGSVQGNVGGNLVGDVQGNVDGSVDTVLKTSTASVDAREIADSVWTYQSTVTLADTLRLQGAASGLTEAAVASAVRETLEVAGYAKGTNIQTCTLIVLDADNNAINGVGLKLSNSSGAQQYVSTTNTDGRAFFNADTSTYYVIAFDMAGYGQDNTQDTFNVALQTLDTVRVSAWSITVPSDPTMVTLWGAMSDMGAKASAGQRVTVWLNSGNQIVYNLDSTEVFDSSEEVLIIDTDGVFQKEVPRSSQLLPAGLTYIFVIRLKNGASHRIETTAPDSTTFNIFRQQ